MGGGAGGIGGAVSGLSSAWSDLGQTFSGNSKNAGILGVGQYKNSGVNVDQSAFKDHRANNALYAQLAQQLSQANTRQAPQVMAQSMNAANIDKSADSQFRNQQMALAQQLQQQANGQGPSLAQNQLRQATDRNIQQALAMQASQRGANAGAGLRSAAQNVMAANQQAGAQSADLRLQEQQQAQQALAGVANAGRSGDIGLETNQAGLNQQANLVNAQLSQQAKLANQQASLQQQGLNDTQTRFIDQARMGINQADSTADQDLQKLLVQQNTGLAGVNQAAYADASKNRANMLGGVMSVFGFSGGGKVPGYAYGGRCMADGGDPGPLMGQPEAPAMNGMGMMAPPAGGYASPTVQSPMAMVNSFTPQAPTNTNQSPLLPAWEEPGKELSFYDRFVDQIAANHKNEGDKAATPVDQSKISGQEKVGKGVGEGLKGLFASMSSGGSVSRVPGKAEVPEDSKANDKIPAVLSPGEIVIPRSLSHDDGKILSFVRALRSMPEPESQGDSEIQAKIAKALAHQVGKKVMG